MGQRSVLLVRSQVFDLSLIALSMGIAWGSFGHCALGSDPPMANHVGPKPTSAAAPSTPAGKTLGRILAHWKAREERTRTLYFAWENRLFFGPAAEARSKEKASQQDPRSCQVSEWIEGFDLRRTDTVPLGGSAPNVSVAGVKTHTVDNRSTTLSVDDPDKKAGWPVATFSPRQNPNLLFRPDGVPLTFHALHAFEVNSRSPQFRVVSDDAVVDGLHCVELQNANDKPALLEKCWVDPARDDVVVAYEFWVMPKRLRKLYRTIAIEYQHDRVYGWVPARFTVRQPGTLLSENTVTKYTINERFPDDTFSLKVSTGTIVFDERSFERYRAVADRGKIDVVKFDSPASLRIGEVLERRSDFHIEPQSLKDAIDFIAARYQIPIIVGEADYAAVGIMPPVQVGPIPSGITVTEILQRTLAKSPKPTGSRIEDEVLKISPNFTELGAVHIRPAPTLPKTASAKERKIQETLEMPVDFTVEPQSLKDALEFIAARYQIRIGIDGRIDSTSEVKAGCPGIKLRSLLTILLERCPGELEFKIEDDALKICSKVATK